ncbi:leucine-rich repeat-containing protein [Heterostelium album PN500]|uniref:Leucine-rich repeat-containing protein n=1 Tax=Heterostelium pallidum (strain ATCC 26659 / Pp 5 / PN500) TaxID=670386 RepID=D3BCM1_HETP5|nr:leucine-rich repeat-containing protein [Heterostelium album PN500]EFA80663.1 leucine-rich repeat-containing protein [Heterostelium album PN500]|eukprot:XP_020432783.1 leucine-rich repeat-containing protein [Heterostelium album PN500]
MKLTPDNLSQKLGKKIDIGSVSELSLDSIGVIEVSSFARLKCLEVLDLSQNRLQQIRHIKGLFDLPKLRELNLIGNPVTKAPNYRHTVVGSIPTLQVLDGKEISNEEREASKLPIVKDPLSNGGDKDDEEEDEPHVVAKPVPKVVEQPKSTPAPVAATPAPTPKPVEQPKPTPVATPTPKPVEQPKPTPKPVEQPKPTPTPSPTPAAAAQAASSEPTVREVNREIKKKLVIDEDVLFESSSKPKSISFEKDDVDDSLFSTDDDLNKFEKKKPAAAPKKASSITFVDDDEDDLFGSSKKKSTTSTTKKVADIDDDLFGDFEEKSGLSKDFDIDSYLSSQKDRKKSNLFE